MRDDQATGLRRLFAPSAAPMLAVTGEAATPIAVDLAAALARAGRRVLIVDRSRAEAAAAFGLRVRYDFAHVSNGHKHWPDVALGAADGVTLLPAARGLDEIACEGGDWRDAIGAAIGAGAPFDVWLVNGMPPPRGDVAAIVLPLAPTASAITTAYARIKALAIGGRRTFGVVVHGARSDTAAADAYRSVAETAQRFLRARLDYHGAIPAAEPGQPIAERRSARGRAFASLAESLVAPAAQRAVAC
jgi:MinD-like ATPase involved in chromosome partitioning or flagellar assembly